MKINWKVRIHNPLWWVQIASAILLPILAYFGLTWDNMTTWAVLAAVFARAVQNPVVLVSVLISVFNCIVDPTTAGISDSSRALGYSVPYKDGNRND